jgi:hypothetical protein
MKVRMTPVAMPGRASGHSTRQNIRHGPAPRLKAASSSERSMLSMTLCRVSTMKGRLTAMIPMMTAASVYMISTGAALMPRPSSPALTTPLVPSSVMKPAARTALPTNSGSTTSMIRMFLNRLRVRAST